MKISERTPGDLLYIDDEGAAVCVELGNILGARGKGKKIVPHMVLVTSYDPDTGRLDSSTWRAVNPDVEVRGVHESYEHRREMRAMGERRRGGTVDNNEVDPMLQKQGGGF